RYLYRMNDIGFARFAILIRVGFLRIVIGMLNQFNIIFRQIFVRLIYNIFYSYDSVFRHSIITFIYCRGCSIIPFLMNMLSISIKNFLLKVKENTLFRKLSE